MADTFLGNNDDYVIESAVFSTDRTTGVNSYNIAKLISDLEIYEHIDKPYLTGKVMFVDSYAILENIDFQGGEKLTITIKPLLGTDTLPIIKTFYTQKVLSSVKVNDTMQAVGLYLIEDIAFISSVYNVNKSYTGSPKNIIQNISLQYLSRDIYSREDTYQDKLKVIVPNLHPIDAMVWIKNKSTTSDGLPYYLYSVLGDDSLRFYDLGTMLRQGPMNAKNPFVYWQSASQVRYGDKHLTIQNFEYNNTDDLLSLIRSGMIGAKYSFYDTMAGESKEVEFDIDADVFKNLVNKDYLDKNQNRYNYGPGYKVNEKPLSQYNSIDFSQISSADVYKNSGDFKTINQELDEAAYKKRIVGNAIKNFMTKTPITIQVRGAHFIDRTSGRENLTLGNTIRVLIAESVNDLGRRIQYDKKKSGDYIIYAARHMFSKERYDAKLLCTKLASYVEDPV